MIIKNKDEPDDVKPQPVTMAARKFVAEKIEGKQIGRIFSLNLTGLSNFINAMSFLIVVLS